MYCVDLDERFKIQNELFVTVIDVAEAENGRRVPSGKAENRILEGQKRGTHRQRTGEKKKRQPNDEAQLAGKERKRAAGITNPRGGNEEPRRIGGRGSQRVSRSGRRVPAKT